MSENEKMTSTVVDPVAREVVLSVVTTLFSDIAVLDQDTMLENLEKLTNSENGFSQEDRSISAELADYLLKNMAYIYSGIILNDGFRGEFMDAVAKEIELEGKDPEIIKEKREAMNGNLPKPEEKGYVVFDFTAYNDDIFKTISGKIYHSFAEIGIYDESMTKIIGELDENDRLKIGFCASNYAYLIRAFIRNRRFCYHARQMIDIVKRILNDQEESKPELFEDEIKAIKDAVMGYDNSFREEITDDGKKVDLEKTKKFIGDLLQSLLEKTGNSGRSEAQWRLYRDYLYCILLGPSLKTSKILYDGQDEKLENVWIKAIEPSMLYSEILYAAIEGEELFIKTMNLARNIFLNPDFIGSDNKELDEYAIKRIEESRQSVGQWLRTLTKPAKETICKAYDRYGQLYSSEEVDQERLKEDVMDMLDAYLYKKGLSAMSIQDPDDFELIKYQLDRMPDLIKRQMEKALKYQED